MPSFWYDDLTQSKSIHGKMFKVYPKTPDAEAILDTYNIDCFTKVER